MLYDVVTFDCYGTLVDWNAGIRDAFARAAESEGVEADATALRDAYAEIEPVVEAMPYRRYREVLAETARRAAERTGWAMGERTAQAFAASLPEWRPFPDTNVALERLSAAGIRLGILSNVDRDLLAGTLGHLAVAFDLIITAEDIGSYKPAHGHFLEARRRVGDDARWLHAAQSYFHDVVPCAALGIDSAWINRNDEPAGGDVRPTRELASLADLANWLAPA
jgi:2-haloalkanoic acid dehalogenase type II